MCYLAVSIKLCWQRGPQNLIDEFILDKYHKLLQKNIFIAAHRFTEFDNVLQGAGRRHNMHCASNEPNY